MHEPREIVINQWEYDIDWSRCSALSLTNYNLYVCTCVERGQIVEHTTSTDDNDLPPILYIYLCIYNAVCSLDTTTT